MYPNCFKNYGEELPLKTGIMVDLFDENGKEFELVSHQVIIAAIRIYVSSMCYRASLMGYKAYRVNLKGQLVEPVLFDEQLQAKFKPIQIMWNITKEDSNRVRELKSMEREFKKNFSSSTKINKDKK